MARSMNELIGARVSHKDIWCKFLVNISNVYVFRRRSLELVVVE